MIDVEELRSFEDTDFDGLVWPVTKFREVADEITELRAALSNLITSWEYDGDLTRDEIEKARMVLK